MPPYKPYISKDFTIAGAMLRLDDMKKAWEQIDGRHRTSIRKAQKSGVIIKKSRGTPAELRAFRTICLNPEDMPKTITSGGYHLYLAHLKDKIVAGILLAEIGDVLFMLCHASVPQAKEHGIPSLLIWHAAEQHAGKKFRAINIGASYRPSLQKFFQGWATSTYPVIMKPPEILPSLMLTPFDTAALGVELPSDALHRTQVFLDHTFGDRPRTFFPRAMYAISTLIKSLDLKKKDEVYVTTTTDTHYVSSCVSSAIEQHATFARKLSAKTKAIFVIHEFGFPHPKLKELRKEATKRKIPLIEDCAYAWHTKGIGTVGDYAIYSLTKTFPVEFGGLLIGRHFTHDELWQNYGTSDRGKEDYTYRALAPWIDDDIGAARRRNYERYEELFGAERTYFPLDEKTVPGAYILKMDNEKTMKDASAFVRSFGIECGNYWRNSAIILPVHQRLTPRHIDYIAGAVFATERKWCGIPFHP